jgi:uncharacterized phage protein gp47/JayE
MASIKKSLGDMTRDSIRYLSRNTDITYFSQGSIARALVEATNLEISRLQEFVTTQFENSFLSTAQGIYLDLFGETLGLPRIRDRRANATVEDGAVRFFVDSGTLGSRLRDPGDPSRGLIRAGAVIRNAAGTVEFSTTVDTSFPINATSAFVPVIAATAGSEFNVGANQLVVHDLGVSDVKVTNDITITTGSDLEPDEEYRFRLSRAMSARFCSNEAAVQVAAMGQPGVSDVRLVPFARGAGTFDVLVIPQGNRLQQATKDNVRRAVEQIVAYGVNHKVREPEYVPFKLTVQLRFTDETPEGRKGVLRRAVEASLLRYFSRIPIGGQLVINQIRSAALNTDRLINDVRIIELCLDGKPRTLRNVRLREDELFIPDSDSADPVKVI